MSNKVIKKLIISSLLLAAVVVVVAFILNSDRQPPNHNEIVRAALEEKYGGQFEIVSSRRSGATTGSPWGFIATSDMLPGRYINVNVQIENLQRASERILVDNFFAIKYEEETIAFLHNIATDVFGEAIIHYEASGLSLSQGLPANTTFEEFFADTSALLRILIEVKESDFISEEQAIKAAEAIAAGGAHFRLDIMVLADDVFGTLDREELRANIMPQEHLAHHIRVNHSGDGLDVRRIGR